MPQVVVEAMPLSLFRGGPLVVVVLLVDLEVLEVDIVPKEAFPTILGLPMVCPLFSFFLSFFSFLFFSFLFLFFSFLFFSFFSFSFVS